MSAKPAVIALGVLLMAGAPFAEAQHGGGGSHGNGSHGGGGSSGGGHGQSSGGGRPVSGAEARHPVAGTGHGYYSSHYYGHYPYYYGGYYPYYYGGYYPYYGYGPYFGLGFSYGGYYGGGYYADAGGGYYDYDTPYYRSTYPPYRYRYRETGSIRTLVEPENTKVYVDGYYAGQVDDFDGMFQRLYAGAGRHDVAFKLEGYRSHRVKVYVTEDHTIMIRHTMEKGAGEETVEDLTEGRENPPHQAERDRDEEDNRWVPRDGSPRPRQPLEAREGGSLRLEIRPDDATVYVDGEFYGPARRGGSLSLPAGRHHIEVVRPGFRTMERDVEIRPGKTESVAVDLERS